MITSNERNASPTIKELLEALSAEERGEAAAARPSPRHTHPAPHQAAPAPARRQMPEPRAAAHTHAMRHAAHADSASLSSLEFEQGGGSPRGPHGSPGIGAQVPRHAPPPPPSHTFAFDMEEAEWSQRPRSHAAPRHERLSVDRERALELLRGHVRLPAIARHTLTAAGTLAIVLPSALYLAAPVLVRMEEASSAATPAAVISQRNVNVAAITVPKPPVAPTHAAAAAHGDVSSSTTTIAPAASASAAVDASAPTPERTLALLERGRTLSAARDVTAARHFFVRAADAGNAEAALAAARSYDPAELAALGYIGIKGDVSLARKYYAIAVAGGAPEAQEQLDRLPPP